MGYHANADERRRFIAGLRDLAEFLETSSNVPIPPSAYVMFFPSFDTDAVQRKAIDAIAASIGARTHEHVSGHYTVSRFFGPVEYRAVAIDHDPETNTGEV